MVNRRSVSTIASQRDSGRERPAFIPFGDLVRQFRVAAGLTQEELAERATISARAVSDLERGERRRPQRETLRLLADALNLTGAERARFEAAARAPATGLPRLVPRDPPHTLPAAMTPLVGRERDLAAVAALLAQPATRLVTITGVGGVGKTRVALAAATAALPSFPDGLAFVPLAAIRDAALVLPAIAQALGLKERGAQAPRESLVEHLRRKRLLLVLDNFEHLIPAASAIGELLAACGGLTALVTSRAALHLRGEQACLLRPLALPDPQKMDDLAHIRRSPAVTLFVQRATAVADDFVLESATAPIIAAICARLDGLPLALELAAARTRVLPPAELLARLEHRFSVLTDGARDLPARQQTMRQAIDWSYDLLPADEQRLFRWLAVFAGGCTLEAAEAVGSAMSGGPVPLLDTMTALVDQNLVQVDRRADGVRFTMLETVRAYGLERLTAAEADGARRAASDYFLTLATASASTAIGEGHARWLAQLDVEHDNLRAALAWARERDEPQIGLRLAAALGDFWYLRGHLREGRAWLAAMLALDAERATPASVRAAALCGIATLALRQGDITAAAAYATESLARYRDLRDRGGMATARNLLGNAVFEHNDYAAADTHYAASLALRRETGDRLGTAVALHNLGGTARAQGDYARALRYYRESEALNREIGHLEGLAGALATQGLVARDCGDPAGALPLVEEGYALYERVRKQRGIGITLAQRAMIANDTGRHADATAYAERSMAVRRASDDRSGIAESFVILGDIATATGDRARAWACYCDGLAIYREIGNALGVATCLERLGQAMARGQEWESAARCFGAADAVRERIHAPVLPVDRPSIAQVLADTRSALGDDRFIAAYDAGRAMDTAGAIAEATAPRP